MGTLKKIWKEHDDINPHYEPVTVDNGAADYCMKEDTRYQGPWELGTKPKTKKNGTLDWDKVKEAAQKGLWEEIDSSAYIRYYGNLKKIGAESTEAYEHNEVRGIWIWGAPGTGKTTSARNDYGDKHDVFIKSQSKWWDGYIGQSIVVLDDLDTDVLGHYLKIWADKWACTGEIKGGTVQLRHKVFIVTSNFSIAGLFKCDTLIAALKRRFKEIEMTNELSLD